MCVVPLLRVLQLICSLAILVFGDQVFGLFSLERWLVCRLVRKIPLDCKIASDCKSSLDLSPMSRSRLGRFLTVQEICSNNSSILGICGLLFMQL